MSENEFPNVLSIESLKGGEIVIFILACLVSGMVGALGMALFSVGAYEKGFADGKELNKNLNKEECM